LYLVPVPKKPHPSQPVDFRLVALTLHVMKTLEQLLLQHLRPQVQHAQDPLQFAYQEKVEVEDAILYLLQAHSHLDWGSGTVRIMFFDFSSAFNTIQPILLKDKLSSMGVDAYLVSWIVDYLTERPQFVRLGGCIFGHRVLQHRGTARDSALPCPVHTLYIQLPAQVRAPPHAEIL